MTQKLTPEETKALLDDLFALPDAPAKSPKKSPKKITGPLANINAVAKAVNRNPNFRPVLSIIEIVHQQCTTCGSEHEFIRSRRVRFEATRKGDLATAHEIETLTPEHLPRRIDDTYELTNVCPTCARLSRVIDDFTEVQSGFVQQELFHG